MNKGKFIVFEGIDTCGKDTQIEILKAYLKEENKNNFIFTREPGSHITDTTQKIREILLNSKENLNTRTESLLFAADRSHHVEKINQLLNNGYHVICNRYFYSTIAYQYNKNSIKDILALCSYATNNLIPDIYIYFNINIDEFCTRMKAKKDLDRIEKKNIEYFEKVINNYNHINDIIKNNNYNCLCPKNTYTIDGTKSIVEISDIIKNILKEKEII